MLKKVVALLVLALSVSAASTSFAANTHHSRGYYKQDGTYVRVQHRKATPVKRHRTAKHRRAVHHRRA